MATAVSTPLRRFAPIVLPVAAILAARVASYSDWATANAALAGLLLVWIAADALALGAIARAPKHRPGLYKVVGALAAGCIIALLGAAPPVRAALLAMPPVMAAMALTVAVFAIWSLARLASVWRDEGSLFAALDSILPAPLLRFARLEHRMMRIGLFSWNAPPDVPHGRRPFFYHRYLTPMVATFMALQAIELAVVHLLVSLWSETVALVLLALSIWGLVWLVALLKSFRLYPVLLDERVLQVRSGMIVDAAIPRDAIAGLAPAFDAETLKARDTLNTAILAAPNVCIALARPVAIPKLLGGTREVRRIAMRLEDSAGFTAALQRKP